MKRLTDLEKDRRTAAVMVELTSAFEGIASTRITQIRDQVLRSTQFFGDLWRIYIQIRVGSLFRFGRSQTPVKVIKKQLMILITSEGGFSGEIDQNLVAVALAHYQPDLSDIIVIGHHGLTLLEQSQASVAKSFRMPINDRNINILPLIAEVQKYQSTVVFYQFYTSLMSQEVRTIELSAALAQKGAAVARGQEEISERNYIFEPTTTAVVDHLENSMMQIMLREVIMESKLAQYASRFKAMRLAREKADDSYSDLRWRYNRAKRQTKDERLKELINGLRLGVPK